MAHKVPVPHVNRFYKLLVFAFTLSMFAEGVILPIYAIFVQRIGGDILDAGNAMGIFLITQGFSTVTVHRVRWSPRVRIVLMILGWAVWVAGIASYLLISNVLMLFVTQVLTATVSFILILWYVRTMRRMTLQKLFAISSR